MQVRSPRGTAQPEAHLEGRTARSGPPPTGPRLTPSGVDRVFDALGAVCLVVVADGRKVGRCVPCGAVRAPPIGFMPGGLSPLFGVPHARVEPLAQPGETFPNLFTHCLVIGRSLAGCGGRCLAATTRPRGAGSGSTKTSTASQTSV